MVWELIYSYHRIKDTKKLLGCWSNAQNTNEQGPTSWYSLFRPWSNDQVPCSGPTIPRNSLVWSNSKNAKNVTWPRYSLARARNLGPMSKMLTYQDQNLGIPWSMTRSHGLTSTSTTIGLSLCIRMNRPLSTGVPSRNASAIWSSHRLCPPPSRFGFITYRSGCKMASYKNL